MRGAHREVRALVRALSAAALRACRHAYPSPSCG